MRGGRRIAYTHDSPCPYPYIYCLRELPLAALIIEGIPRQTRLEVGGLRLLCFDLRRLCRRLARLACCIELRTELPRPLLAAA